MSSTPERWRSLEDLYQAALDLPADQRVAFLNEACPDEQLRGEVQSLLGFAKGGTLLHSTAFMHPLELKRGDNLGPYCVEERIGAGGMGEVYRALDARLARDVAIKILPPAMMSDPERRARFVREAQSASRLNHPNIVTVYDIGESDGMVFIAMEYLAGTTLAEALRPAGLPVATTLKYAISIASALSKAHAMGIVHRDLKPGNVMVTPEGVVKVLDFGLAKLIEEPSTAESAAKPAPPMTKPGLVFGTPAFMSPEQAEGKPVDARSDVFSFGAVVYEMATGKHAFHKDSMIATIAAVIHEEPEPLPPAVPRDLVKVILRCLRKDPDRRWQHMSDVKVALEEILEDSQSGKLSQPLAAGSKPRSRITILSLAIGTTVCAILALLSLWFFRRPIAADEPIVQFQIAPPPSAQFVLSAGGGSAISPDGRTIAFVAGSGGDAGIWIRPLGSLTAHELANTEGAHLPFWSPDSRSLGFFARGKLKRTDLHGGSSVDVADAPAPLGGTWNSEGVILFAPRETGFVSVPATGGTPTPVTTVDAASHEFDQRFPHFLPGGRRFLYFSRNVESSKNAIMCGSLDRPTERIRLIDSLSPPWYIPPRGRNPGYLLWLRQETLMVRPFDPGAARFTGDALPVPGAEGVSAVGSLFYSGVSASSDGALLFGGGIVRSRLSWFSRDGKNLGQVGAPDRYIGIAISPDATRLAVVVSDSSGAVDAATVDLARGVETRLTSGGNGLGAIWSGGDQRIIYYPVRANAIYERSANGAGKSETILESKDTLVPDDVSPDGRYLLYDRLPDGGQRNLWILPRHPQSGEAKSTPYLQLPSNQLNAKFSPDGKWIAYTSTESGRPETYVQGFPAGEQRWQVSGGGGNFARWRHDGKELFYRATDGTLMVASVRAASRGLEFGTPTALFTVGATIGSHSYPYDIAPDGQRILAIEKLAEDTSSNLKVLVNWQASLKP